MFFRDLFLKNRFPFLLLKFYSVFLSSHGVIDFAVPTDPLFHPLPRFSREIHFEIRNWIWMIIHTLYINTILHKLPGFMKINPLRGIPWNKIDLVHSIQLTDCICCASYLTHPLFIRFIVSRNVHQFLYHELAFEMKVWNRPEKGRGTEFGESPRKAFPFSEEVITGSGLKQFCVMHRWHDGGQTPWHYLLTNATNCHFSWLPTWEWRGLQTVISLCLRRISVLRMWMRLLWVASSSFKILLPVKIIMLHI